MTKTSIALTELAEKGANVDMLRDILEFATQRLMELDVEGRCDAPYGERGIPRIVSDQLREKISETLHDARRRGDRRACIHGFP